MKVVTDLAFKCSRCGGRKCIGDEYYAMSQWFIDITCLNCADSKDIAVIDLLNLCHKLGDKNARIIE
jgi:hypothetical protein